MKSLAILPLDFYYDSTISITEWLEEDPERHAEYVHAVLEYGRNGAFELPLRCVPRVAFNVFNDTHFFIFKQDNNGTCVLVGRELPPVPNECKLDVPENWEMT